jgi:hypothetical protein
MGLQWMDGWTNCAGLPLKNETVDPGSNLEESQAPDSELGGGGTDISKGYPECFHLHNILKMKIKLEIKDTLVFLGIRDGREWGGCDGYLHRGSCYTYLHKG